MTLSDTAEATRRTSSDPVVVYGLAILLLPLLVLGLQTDPLFNPLWQTDPWFYLGYFRDLVNFKRDLFPGFYYGSRLSWILPGYLVHSIFSPLIANAILHLTVHSIATLSLFSILRLTVGLRGAYLTAMVFSFHPWLWCATGWDHANGAALAYYLLAMALLTRAAVQPVRRRSLIFAGMALAGSVYAHLFLAAFAPLLALYYVVLTGAFTAKQIVQSLRPLGLWGGVGFVGVTAPLCAVNYFLLDGSPWFWAPSLRTAQSVMQSYLWSESIWADGQLVPWLWFIVVTSMIAMALVLPALKRGIQEFKSPGLLFSAQLLLATAFMAYLQSRGITLLGHYYYACYLLPFVFLVIGAVFWPAADNMRPRTFACACCIATLIFGALWYGSAAHPIPRLTPEWEEVLLGGCIIAGAFVLRRRKSGMLLAIAGLAVLTSAVYKGSYRHANLHSTREEYARIMKARRRIEELRNGTPIRFWYDKQDPGFLEYFALNASYLAEFSRMGESFPRDCIAPEDPRTLIVVSSQKEQAAELARSALRECWQPYGMHPEVESAETMEGRGGPYTMALIRAAPGAVSKSPPGELFETIPLDRVTLGAPGALLQRWPDSMDVTTLPGVGAFAGRVNLALDPNQRERLEVHVRLRVLKGRVGLGILDPESRAFLLERPVWPTPQPIEMVLPLPSPPIIGDLVIRNLTVKKFVSQAVVEKIEVRKTP